MSDSCFVGKVFPACPLWRLPETRWFCEHECRYRKQGFCKPKKVD